MSVQFGRWNVGGPPPAADLVETVAQILAPHGPDSKETYLKDGLAILYGAFNTTHESCLEIQPHVFASGTVIACDGRLDNRTELLRDLSGRVSCKDSDLAIVACASEN